MSVSAQLDGGGEVSTRRCACSRRLRRRWLLAAMFGLVSQAVAARSGFGSTYVVMIPLGSPVYEELETLNGLGYLDTYLDEILPISRIEAARLTIEADNRLTDLGYYDPLAKSMIRILHQQLEEEIGWLLRNSEDTLPSMLHPLEQAQVQYVYSGGPRRYWRGGISSQIDAREGTPLLPYNDGLPTSSGSNEIARASSWAGLAGFLTLYGEGAAAGSLTRADPGADRFQPLGAEVVASFGNVAVSFGREERWWGTGHFAALSQSNNAPPFYALTVQNIHPTYLPGFLRYLGPGRRQFFIGQGDGGRYWSHPWILGHDIVFKPLPTFELGITRAIMFGGAHNSRYDFTGFLGRATGIDTGNRAQGQTNSRGGVYLKFYLRSLRNTQVYQEILGEDNLTAELRPIGQFIPFLAVSYQGGIYVPRLTADGRTDLRFEYAILEPNYSIHADSLYWTYQGSLMGDAMGPDSTQVDIQVGRWLTLREKLTARLFYTEQAPTFGTNEPYPVAFYPYPLTKEHSVGAMLDFHRLPRPMTGISKSLLWGWDVKFGVEYAFDMNYHAQADALRTVLQISTRFEPMWPSLRFR